MTGGGAPCRRWQWAREAFSAAAEVILCRDRSLYIPRGSGGAEKNRNFFCCEAGIAVFLSNLLYRTCKDKRTKVNANKLCTLGK